MVYPGVEVVPGRGQSCAHGESRITITLISAALPTPPLCRTRQSRGAHLAPRNPRPFPVLGYSLP